jgi:hypothetical protein
LIGDKDALARVGAARRPPPSSLKWAIQMLLASSVCGEVDVVQTDSTTCRRAGAGSRIAFMLHHVFEGKGRLFWQMQEDCKEV